jgi:hypothetical protein
LESNTIFPLVNGYGTIGSGTTNQFNFYQTTGAGVFRGAILSLNSITASETRTYTLPDASGTVALTTDLGAYLPLTGGTLTGALNGTSAAFTGAVSGSAVTITATTGIAGDFTNNSTTNEALRARNNGSGNIAAFRNASAEVASITNSGGLTLSGALSGTSASFSGNLSINTSNILLGLGNGASNESLIFSYNDNAASRSWRIIKDWTAFGDFQIQQSTTKTGTTYSDILRFTSTGAATFSSSVTAKGTLTIGESLVENGIINSPEGIYINADSDASGGSNDIVFGKGRTSTSGGTTFMTIKNGGNVGIGTASPTDFGSTYKVLSIDGAGGGGVLDLMNTGVRSLTLAVDGGEPSISSRVSGNPIVFRTNNAGTVAERMRITSEGNVGINQPSPTSALEIRSNSSNGWLKLSTTSGNPFISSTNNLAFYTVNTNEVLNLTGDGVAVMITGGGFANQTTLDANTRFQGPNNSATAAKCYAWNTYSDQRIKEDINPLTYGLNELMQLNPVSYNQHDSEVIDGEIVLKETYKPTIGLIAQDVYDLIPESVGVGNDTELWGLDYDKIVPVLIKAIQELKTEIDSLKNQIK